MDLVKTDDYPEKAASFFYAGYNCAQATALAFAEFFDLKTTDVQKAMAGFGGGFSGRRETCGAISAMVYILGLAHGDYEPNDNDKKTAFYELVRSAIEDFEKEFGTTICKNLLEEYDINPQKNPQVRDEAYYRSRPCALFIKKAARLIAKNLQRKELA